MIINYDIFKTKKKAVLKKKIIRLFKINDKTGIAILLKILDQIQNESEDGRNCIDKFITTICKEEGISSE